MSLILTINLLGVPDPEHSHKNVESGTIGNLLITHDINQTVKEIAELPAMHEMSLKNQEYFYFLFYLVEAITRSVYKAMHKFCDIPIIP